MICLMCRRTLDVPGEYWSTNCGGDCWGCIFQIERDSGFPFSAEELAEIQKHLPVDFLDEVTKERTEKNPNFPRLVKDAQEKR